MKITFSSKTSRIFLAATLVLVAAIALDAAIYFENGRDGNGQQMFKLGNMPIKTAGVNPFSKGTMATFVVRRELRDIANVTFRDSSGTKVSLSDWRGKVVLLNLWAAWCAPCRQEMPALDRLQGEMGSNDFEVVAVSIDRKGVAAAQKFLDEIETKHLRTYIDKSGRISREIDAFGMPTTVLISREGKEIGRLIGPAEWNSNQAKALITAAIRGKLIGVKAK